MYYMLLLLSPETSVLSLEVPIYLAVCIPLLSLGSVIYIQRAQVLVKCYES